MRNWLHEGQAAGRDMENKDGKDKKEKKRGDRVIVVHCKAGKGRSGSMACSFLISECGWSAEEALARFTERRMRPGFGKGVSIPSQLRWIGYVDRWTRGGKKYVDQEVEVVEIHVWGLRNGVKVSVEGFVDEGKKIKVFHTFRREERIVVEGDAPGGGGVMDLVSDMYSPREEGPADGEGILGGETYGKTPSPQRSKSKTIKNSRTSKLMDRLSRSGSKSSSSRSSSIHNSDRQKHPQKSKTIAMAADSTAPTSANPPPAHSSSSSLITPKVQSQTDLPGTGSSSPVLADSSEPGGQAVIFKPAEPIRIPNSDVNISVERRNRPPASMGMMTMVTAVAHVWFNTYFEGNGPEQDGKADESGVFEIDWEKMDGIKGSSRKGTRAFDRMAVVWRAAAKAEGEEGAEEAGKELPYLGPGIVIEEPGVDSPVPQMRPADWKGENEGDPDAGKGLGLRAEDPDSAAVSKASSVKSAESGGEDEVKDADDDGDSLKGVKTSGPTGEEELDVGVGGASDPAKEEGGKGGQKDKADVIAQKGFVVE